MTDGDIRGLGTLEKPNPQYKGGAPMQLLLECQVRILPLQLTLQRAGSALALINCCRLLCNY